MANRRNRFIEKSTDILSLLSLITLIYIGIGFSNIAIATDKCYAMTDDYASFYVFDLDPSTPPTVVNLTQVFNGEGTAYRATDNALYAFHQDDKDTENPSDLYKIELDGSSTLIATNFIPKRAAGAEFVKYSDGTEWFIVLMEESAAKIEVHDATDLANSTPISTLNLKDPDGSDAKVSSLAVDPSTGEILVMADREKSGIYSKIYSVNMLTGQLTLKTTFAIQNIDAEAFAFAEDGYAYTENENFGVAAYNHKIFRINMATGALMSVEENINAVVSGDIETLSCTGSKIITQTPPPVLGCFDPILIDDDGNHTIWQISGASEISDLTGVDLNDGIAPDLVQVGSYSLGHNFQDLAYNNNGDVWGIAVGTGDAGTSLGHAYIGQLTENNGVYSFTNIIDLDAGLAVPTYNPNSYGFDLNGDPKPPSLNHGKAMIWDPDNEYFIYEANYLDKDTATKLKAYDPVTQTVVTDPWGTGSPVLELTMPVTQRHNYMQGLAFSPDGDLYGIVGSTPSILIKLDRNATTHKLTGNYTVVGAPGLDVDLRNVEILDFMSDGQLLLIESNAGLLANKSKVFTVDINTGVTTVVADLDNGHATFRDWEGIKFCNAPYEPETGISGVVFQDDNTNDIQDNGEVGLLSIAISVYNDINGNGSIDGADSVLRTTNSDANGSYTFSNLADSNYLLRVDDNDTDLPANIMLGGTNPLAVVVNGSMITDQDFPFDPSACTALSGETSEVAAGVAMQIASGDQVFVASSSPAPNKQGHFRAYKVLTNGAIKIASEWDADDKMDATDRQLQLYSTDTSGSKILFNALDNDAFSRSGADPTVDKIKEYSFNPSVDSDIYLAGRASGSYLGTLSRGNDVTLLENRIDTWSYLDDPAYRPFALTISSRPQKALVSSDDGFVYAFNQSGGDLAWGWMPRQLVKELKNYNSFQSHGYMSGKLDTLAFKHSGSYGAYVIGSYKNGLGQYTLKLDTTDNDNLEGVVWDQDHSQLAFDEAPNQGERAYFTDGVGNTYTAYIISKSNLSTLIIKKLGDNTAATEVALDFHVTSTPFVMPDFSDSLAPAKKTIYLGAKDGNIKRATLLDGTSLEIAANIKTALEGAAVGTLADNDQAITFLGAASAETGSGYYMRAQSDERLTVLKYNSGTTDWEPVWTSYASGAGSWDSSNSYTADNSGIPTDNDSDGFFTDVTENGIQSIPTGAIITDAAQIVAGTVILPVSVPTAGSCAGKAYYYLYKLNAGVFPDAKFTKLDHSPIIGNIALGYGEPKRVEIADMASINQTIGYGNTDQKQNNTTGVTASFIIHDSIATGIRGWKERTQ